MAATMLNRNAPLPLWAQLLADLRRRIAAGEFSSRFPTDVEIGAEYAVSRQTVREAARRLQGEGVIVRERGRGSVVAASVLEQPLHAPYSLAQTAQEHGLSERSEVVALERRPAGEAAGPLHLTPAADVVYVERLRYVGDDPLSLDRSYVPIDPGACLLTADLSSGSLYDVIAASTGVSVTGGVERVHAEVPGAALRRRLRLGPGRAVLVVERVVSSTSGPLEWRRSVVRGDRYSFRAEWPGTE